MTCLFNVVILGLLRKYCSNAGMFFFNQSTLLWGQSDLGNRTRGGLYRGCGSVPSWHRHSISNRFGIYGNTYISFPRYLYVLYMWFTFEMLDKYVMVVEGSKFSKVQFQLASKVEANFFFLLNFYATFAADGVPPMTHFQALHYWYKFSGMNWCNLMAFTNKSY